MQARALKRLMQLRLGKRLDAISEGLGLLVEQVATLNGDLALLAEAKRQRGLEMLSAQADEEAAKVLILLDAVRMDQRDERALARALGRFYDHLARCIYVEMAEMSPADLGEVRRLVETMRPSHYLDGPNEVDWIFPNQLLARREQSLYVDYVHEEEGDRWVTPATNDGFLLPRPMSAIRELVGALHRLGCTSSTGLMIIGEAWKGATLDDGTRWTEVAAISRSIVERLVDEGIAHAEATPQDTTRVIEQWPFPMGAVDLSELRVSRSELAAERDRWAPDL